MKIKGIFVLAFVLATGFFLKPVYADSNGEGEKKEKNESKLIQIGKRLINTKNNERNRKDERKREAAASQIYRRREEFLNWVINYLENHEWKPVYNSKAHLLIEILADWNAKEALPLLMEQIDWKLNPDSFPGGEWFTKIMRYPCAVALEEFGGKEIWYSIERRLPIRNKKRNHLMGWVLYEIGPRKGFSKFLILDRWKYAKEESRWEEQSSLETMYRAVDSGDYFWKSSGKDHPNQEENDEEPKKSREIDMEEERRKMMEKHKEWKKKMIEQYQNQGKNGKKQKNNSDKKGK